MKTENIEIRIKTINQLKLKLTPPPQKKNINIFAKVTFLILFYVKY